MIHWLYATRRVLYNTIIYQLWYLGAPRTNTVLVLQQFVVFTVTSTTNVEPHKWNCREETGTTFILSF